MFFVSSIRNPTKSFNILQYVTFSQNFTRASVNYKLIHHISRTNQVKHFYFHCLPRLWNCLPTINLDQSLSSIKFKLRQFLCSYFINHFNPDNPCTFHFICPCAKCAILPVVYNYSSLLCFVWYLLITAVSACTNRPSVQLYSISCPYLSFPFSSCTVNQ